MRGKVKERIEGGNRERREGEAYIKGMGGGGVRAGVKGKGIIGRKGKIERQRKCSEEKKRDLKRI